MRIPAIAAVAAALSLLMTASATAQMRGFRDGPIPFGPMFVPRDEPRGPFMRRPRDEPPEPFMRTPRDEPRAGTLMRGQREPQLQTTHGRGQRIETPRIETPRVETPPPVETVPVAQARISPPAAAPLMQLNMDSIPNLTPDGVRKVQQLLRDRGLNPGRIDGVVGPLTNAAIRAFQEGYGIKARGDIDNQTLFALGAMELAGEAN